MLRSTLLIIHAVEFVLYTYWFHDSGDSLLDWLVDVAGFALLVRLAIIALTFAIARTPRQPLALALHVLAAEYAAAVFVFSYSALRTMPDLIAPTHTRRQHLPVLFIHGFACNAGFWRRFIALFGPRWGAYCGTVTLEPVRGSIDDYAPAVEQRIDELLEAAQADRCLIVAHSMGGLATLRSLSNTAVRERVAGVITLGTPHEGTALARFSFALNAKQMRLESDWLEDLHADLAGEDLPPVEALVGTHDNIVSPQENAALSRATNTYMTGISHLAMAMNSHVVEWTLQRCERLSAQAASASE